MTASTEGPARRSGGTDPLVDPGHSAASKPGVLIRCSGGAPWACRGSCGACGARRVFAGPHPTTNHRAAGAWARRHAAGAHTEED